MSTTDELLKAIYAKLDYMHFSMVCQMTALTILCITTTMIYRRMK